jgi:ABC-type transport system involved in cytochrome c biogenesis permease component
MTLLPIVVRELRVAARSRMFYLGRFLTALGAVGLGSYLMVVFNAADFARGMGVAGGRIVFTALAWAGLFYCVGLARNTVDCVSEEKREGTLGLLFLTDLKGCDVALGKLCSNSVKSFYGLLAAVPVVCCAWVMGGVGAGELWMTVQALLNVFFFSRAGSRHCWRFFSLESPPWLTSCNINSFPPSRRGLRCSVPPAPLPRPWRLGRAIVLIGNLCC